jgi:hypothetical protein
MDPNPTAILRKVSRQRRDQLMLTTSHKQDDKSTLDLITHSPDGESRGKIFRAGDFFPMSPIHHILSAAPTPAGDARPWGLRFLTIPTISAGKHEGGSEESSETSSDGPAPNEEKTSD